jgi:SpoVK/Ycf46/Vps4 family AAA+-type ATPase
LTQFDFIRDIAKYGLENDQERLLVVLNELIEHSKNTKKINLALQLQSLLKDAIRQKQSSGLMKVGSPQHLMREEDKEFNDLIIEKLTSDYNFSNLVCDASIKTELDYFVKEHKGIKLLKSYDLPIANKILFHGPSGCGKTLASYVLAGELEKMMIVINLGAIVSSKLGETSKNLAKIFRRAAAEECIILLDEFDSLGKVRDYSQDHGEMKRVVNTILQLFDYLPQESIVVAATNQLDMIDNALLRRFDMKIKLGLPNEHQVKELIEKTLEKSPFQFKTKKELPQIIKSCKGLSFFTIQRTLINAIKRTLFSVTTQSNSPQHIDIAIWKSLIKQEK